MRVFDPQDEFAIVERRLPHWSQSGTISFITFRTWDSIPESVLKSWLAERDNWLRRHGVAPVGNWSAEVDQLPLELISEFQRLIASRWNDHLDACHGACVLQQPEIAKEVADALKFGDGKNYELTDFVIMPNHVHLLAVFTDEASMLNQCESWKHYSAVQINRKLKRTGRFWQKDGFDHLVRSSEQFDHLRRYCADNPSRARLQPGKYLHYSKPLD